MHFSKMSEQSFGFEEIFIPKICTARAPETEKRTQNIQIRVNQKVYIFSKNGWEHGEHS